MLRPNSRGLSPNSMLRPNDRTSGNQASSDENQTGADHGTSSSFCRGSILTIQRPLFMSFT